MRDNDFGWDFRFHFHPQTNNQRRFEASPLILSQSHPISSITLYLAPAHLSPNTTAFTFTSLISSHTTFLAQAAPAHQHDNRRLSPPSSRFKVLY